MEKVVILSNSVGREIEKNVKVTAVRRLQDFEVISMLTSHNCNYFELVEKISRYSNHIFVDLEKKQPLDVDNKLDQAGNLYKRVLGSIQRLKVSRDLKIYPIKLNDLTVTATWTLLNSYYKDLSGLSMGLVGLGNIGSKLALTLTECGVSLKCFNRDKYKALSIMKSIVLTKPLHTIVSPDIVNCVSHAFVNTSGIILSCSDIGCDISSYIPLIKGEFAVFLIGHSLLKEHSLEKFRNNSIPIQRVDIGKQLLSYVKGTLSTETSDVFGSSDYLKSNYCSGGYLGDEGDIIVDRYDNPSWQYGVADGKGGIQYKYTDTQLSNLNDLDKLFN